MINYEKTKIRQYEKFIRELLDSVVQSIDSEKLIMNKKSFLTKAKKRFHLDNDRGWKFLISCLDTIGDSQFAITTFLNHKIKNGKEFNTGEQYLRIYGVLSAIYIQQQAIKKLFDLFKIKESKDLSNEINNLNITFLRHCISAHPINYRTPNVKISFRIDRNSITDLGDISIIDEHNTSTVHNIFESIKAYNNNAERYLEIIGNKAVENTYKSAHKKINEFKEKLNLIKERT